jgi:penicillin-binding protein 1A
MSDSTGQPPDDSPPSRAKLSAPLKKVLLWLSAIVGGIIACVALGLGVALAVAWPNLPEINELTEYRPKLPLRVFSKDGVMIGEFGEERREFVPIDKIPQIMKDALLSIEDERFYEHGGLDYQGILRAGIFNVLKGSSAGGASTITQQVARNFYLSSERTVTRKLYEALLAFKIEKQLTKDQILEVYLNQIFLGNRAYGFAAAAQAYFGKNLADVSVAEAAMLAGLPKAPSAYNPIVNPKRATQRQQYILERMLKLGHITEAQYAQAKVQVLKYRTPVDASAHAEYVAEMVRQLMFAQYQESTYTRGLQVYTTVDSREQEIAYKALRKGLLDYERRQRYRGPEAFVDLPPSSQRDELDQAIDDALVEHPDADDIFAAVVMEASPRKVLAMRQSAELVEITGDGLRYASVALGDKAQPSQKIKRGAIIRIMRNAKNGFDIVQMPEVEGAFVAMSPADGAVRSLVGGFDFTRNKFNHVTQAWRQPGSSFKPFIYSAAIEKGFTPTTIVNDAPLFFTAEQTGGEPWEPKNYDGKFEGPMPLKTALAKSKNMVTIRVMQSVGPRAAKDWVTRFGFDAERHPAYLAMALGAGTVTPLQMAGAYAVFANGGYRINPYLVTRVADYRGTILKQYEPQRAGTAALRAIDDRNAFMMTQLLNEVTRGVGTAAKAQPALKRNDISGKTGTTNDSVDAWFAGYQSSIVAIAWIGYDTPKPLGEKETGGGLALPVWINYMQSALKGVPLSKPVAPQGVTNIGGDYYYVEYTPGLGVNSLGLEDKMPGQDAPPPTSEEERNSILDVFKQAPANPAPLPPGQAPGQKDVP